MKIVLDTNIFISGIHWNGPSEKVIRSWLEKKFILISSVPIIEELVRILQSFKKPLTPEEIEWWKNLICDFSIIVEPTERLDLVKAHPDDNKFFEAAVAGDAQYIITQDHHLLRICDFQGIRVLSPEEFCSLILEN